MARFPEAIERLLNKKICMKCGASNAPRAVRCRRCRSKELRVKARESRGL
ncbi:MAG: 50S ribosomal protein L40e [Petrotogales bacterium]